MAVLDQTTTLPKPIAAAEVRGISLHLSPQGTHLRIDAETAEEWGTDITTHDTTESAIAYLTEHVR